MTQNISNPLSQLKDIKPIVEVHTNSLYILIAISAVVCLVLFIIAFKYFTRIQKTKQAPKKKLILDQLKSLDYSDTKSVVYSFSVDCFLFVDDKNKEEFKSIEKELDQFKYKKDVDKLPDELIKRVQEFIKKLKVGKNKDDK